MIVILIHRRRTQTRGHHRVPRNEKTLLTQKAISADRWRFTQLAFFEGIKKLHQMRMVDFKVTV